MEEAVIVKVVGNTNQGDGGRIIALAQMVEETVSASGLGQYDGWQLEAGGGSVYVYGPSADKLFSIVESVVRNTSLSGVIIRRYGETGAREVHVGF